MNRKGFSLIELMVAVTVLGVIMAGVVMVLINSDKAKRKNEQIIEAQQQGGAALEMLLRDIRSAGYGIPMESDQPIIAYATPFEIIFNANLNPFPDSLGRWQPRDYDPGVSPACPNYGVMLSYGTGAETYRYTFDSDNSGTYAVADRGDDVFETKTVNPFDVVLIRQTYGQMNDNTNNVYPTRNLNIALVRGPAGATDTTVIPMFQYWWRNSSGTLVLHGDTNGDGQLTGNERLFGNPNASILASIEMITITVTTESRSPVDGNNYRRLTVSTTTNLANVPNTTAKYTISGKLVVDGTSTGIEGGKVFLNTGALQTSTATGEYSFVAENGAYVVTPEKIFVNSSNYYILKNPQDSGVTVTNANITDVDFRYLQIAASDMGSIGGYVYNDTIAPGPPAVPTAGERGISGVMLMATGVPAVSESTTIALSTTTDENGYYSFILPRGIYTIAQTDSPGYFSTTPNVVKDTIASDGENLTINFGDSKAAAGSVRITVWKDANKDSTKNPGELPLPNVFCLVLNANSGNVVASGRTNSSGEFLVTIPGDSVYSIIEIDPDSMVSTCALVKEMGTVDSVTLCPDCNRIDSLYVPADSTRELMFGDVVGFVAIALGQTERVLSMITPNLQEVKNPPGDRNNPTAIYADDDIVLGTVKGSSANLLVWYNRYSSPTAADTQVSYLFPATNHGSFDLSYDITALASGDLNVPSLGGRPLSITDDIVVGLKENAGTFNISVGLTHDGGGSGVNLDRDKGLMRARVGNYSTVTPVATTSVLSIATGKLTRTAVDSGRVDFVVGTKDAENLGHIEIWRNGYDTLTTFVRDTVLYDAGGPSIGEVRAIYLADVVDSMGTRGSDAPQFYQDLIVGTKTGSFPNYTGQLIIFRRKGKIGKFTLHRRYDIVDGYINALEAYQSGKASNGKLDIVCGLRVNGAAEDDYRGRLELWYNNDDGTFGLSGQPNQRVDVEGEVLCLSTGPLSLDNINDVAVGIKTEDYLGGTRFFYCSPGLLPPAGSDPSGGDYTGEVVTLRITSNFRPATMQYDIVTGERYMEGGTGYGRVILYYNKN